MKDVFHISPVKGNTILIFKGCFLTVLIGGKSMEQAKKVIPLHGYHTQQALQNLSGPMKGNKLLFEIEKSLNVNPPNYGNGIVHVERRIVKLVDLITKNDKGISLQPREKDQAEEDHETLKNSYLTYGVMYDKEVMVELLCKIKSEVPEYCRIMRVLRQFHPDTITTGKINTNLRVDLKIEMKKRGLKCRCIRCYTSSKYYTWIIYWYIVFSCSHPISENYH